MATASSNSVSSSGTSIIDGLVQGGKWSSGSLTYSFWDTSAGSWSGAEMQSVRDALQTIANVANVTFTEVSSSGTYKNNTSDLSYYFSSLGSDTEGVAFFPDPTYVTAVLPEFGDTRSTYPTAEGDVLLNNTTPSWVSYRSQGGDGFATIIHETGHALGLKHPHDDGGNSKSTFEQLGISGYDTEQYTIMSYNAYNSSSLSTLHAATPMLLDILTLQHIYGANTTYNSGDTVYTLSNDGILKTLWDAGGDDWLDASSAGTSISLKLSPGEYSTIGSTLIAVAYGVYFENANGSSSADSIYGTTSTNYINGLGGSDVLYGGIGSYSPDDSADTVIGGTGSDTLYGNGGGDLLYGGTDSLGSSDSASLIYGGKGYDSIYGGDGADTLYGGGSGYDPLDQTDIIYARAGNDTIYGNGSDDYIFAGDGADVIYGGYGNDTFVLGTGDDTVSGNDGNETYWILSGEGADEITDFSAGDVINLQSNINGLSISSFAQLQSRISDYSGGCYIDLGSSSITLAGFYSSSFTGSEFVFS